MDTSNLVIPNSELIKIPIQDNQEKLVDLRKVCPDLFFNIAWYIKKNGGEEAHEQAHFAREGVAKRLNIAQKILPQGLKLMIDNAYRSPVMQQKSYDNVLKELKNEHPDWTEEELEKEMSNRVSKVEFASHCTGGAVDLTIVDNNEQLDMGTGLDEFTEKTYTNSNLISPKAKENRKILIDAMTKADFINFAPEWWHWSYGDREWAYYQEKKVAIYETVN